MHPTVGSDGGCEVSDGRAESASTDCNSGIYGTVCDGAGDPDTDRLAHQKDSLPQAPFDPCYEHLYANIDPTTADVGAKVTGNSRDAASATASRRVTPREGVLLALGQNVAALIAEAMHVDAEALCAQIKVDFVS
jgi:hypothetical protein